MKFLGLVLCLILAVLSCSAQTIRICSGGAGQITDSLGQVWLTDQYFTGGDIGYTSDPIQGTADSRLYATTRVGLYGDFEYNIPVANGSYALTLRFAETVYWAKGGRVFNVIVNGVPIMTNFDIMEWAPSRTAVDKTFPITVTTGKVRIQFIGVTHRAIVSAIQLESSAFRVCPENVVLYAGESVQFTVVEGPCPAPVTK